MAKSVIYTCDGCGKQKGEANRWFRFAVKKVTVNPPAREMVVAEWDVDDMLANHMHLCGAECVSKKVSEFVGGKANGNSV